MVPYGKSDGEIIVFCDAPVFGRPGLSMVFAISMHCGFVSADGPSGYRIVLLIVVLTVILASLLVMLAALSLFPHVLIFLISAFFGLFHHP